MEKQSNFKWFALLLLLFISLGVKAQIPQTPQDIINMGINALQNMKFDFSNIEQSAPQQQYQQYQQPQQQKQPHQCRVCKGTGKKEVYTPTYTDLDLKNKWCGYCGREVLNPHNHVTCDACQNGYVYY
jgi:RecJ-like exonuclease